MAETLILVNGLPGSGKTTLSRQLGSELGVPVVSKDDLKEAFADITGELVPSGRLGQIASETMWELAAAMPGWVIVESWWFRPRDLAYVLAGIAKSGQPAVMEIWCDVPPDLAWQRYAARVRHPIHPDGQAARAPWAEWMANPIPLSIGHVTSVDTSGPVNVALLAERVRTS
ncbi:AAA family ATPase [Specibacter cremeus]|uniref:AAA family ATPase n=1 Tax=Specibacter cremeus TaxID=1629051 RepID=UPI00197CABBC|nr:ATP-binding protein [Specibacter cremeus]